jgi:hypothetical protein
MDNKFQLVLRLRAAADVRRRLHEMGYVKQLDRISPLLAEAADVIYEDQRFKNSWFYKVWKFVDSL